MEDFRRVTSNFYFCCISVSISLNFVLQQDDLWVDPINISGNISVEAWVTPTPATTIINTNLTKHPNILLLPFPTADDAHHCVSVFVGTHQGSPGVLLTKITFRIFDNNDIHSWSLKSPSGSSFCVLFSLISSFCTNRLLVRPNLDKFSLKNRYSVILS